MPAHLVVAAAARLARRRSTRCLEGAFHRHATRLHASLLLPANTASNQSNARTGRVVRAGEQRRRLHRVVRVHVVLVRLHVRLHRLIRGETAAWREDRAVLNAPALRRSRGIPRVRIAVLLRGHRQEVEHVFLVGEQVLGVHLLQAERRRGLRRGEVVQPTIDLRPRAFLAHHRLAPAIRRHLAEEAIEIHLLATQRGRTVRHDLIGGEEGLEFVHEVRAVLLVVGTLPLHMTPTRRPHSEVDAVVHVHVLLDQARVVLVVVPDVHRALEVRQQAHVQRPTPHASNASLRRHCTMLAALATHDVLRGQRTRRQLLAVHRTLGGGGGVAGSEGRLGRGEHLRRHGVVGERQHDRLHLVQHGCQRL